MRENTLKSIWARGEAVVNGWLSIPSAFSAEFVTLASDGRFLAIKAAEEVAVVRKSGVHAGKVPAY